MEWYKIDQKNILPFPSKTQALLFCLSNDVKYNDIQRIRIRRMSSKISCLLIQQILHLCEQGHSLQSAILSPTRLALDKKISNYYWILQSQLNMGMSLADAFSLILPNKHYDLAAIIPEYGAEETKVNALKVMLSIFTDQNTLIYKVVTSCMYPFLIIQLALIINLVQLWLLKGEVGYSIMVTWLMTSIAQIAFIISVLNGSLYQLLKQCSKSMRYSNYLILLTTLIETGESLHAAIFKLIPGTARRDQIAMHRCYLLLMSGKSSYEALPKKWFQDTSLLQIQQVEVTGDLITPLTQAKKEHRQNCERIYGLITKVIPVFGIVCASVYVAFTLVELYRPLLESQFLGF